jgi:alcohol dehydrogenase class IV
MLLGSMFAGLAFANSPVGAVHALAYPIGSHFHIPHGLSNSLMLPHVIRFNSIDDNCSRMYNDIFKIIFPKRDEIPLKEFNKYEELPLNERLAKYFELLAKGLEIPTKLRDVVIIYSNPCHIILFYYLKNIY